MVLNTNASLPDLPFVTAPIAMAGRVWQVTAVQNQNALLDVADSLEHFPYGFLLWESSVGLARHLAQAPEMLQGKRALELGAGVGVVGMIAQYLGAQVAQTDHQRGALQVARQNAAQNSIAGMRQFLADWRAWQHSERYDLILGADILYERAMHFYLERIFRANLAPGGTLLLSDPGRPQSLECVGRLEKQGWRFQIETCSVLLDEADRENLPVEVAILTGTCP